MIKKASAQQMNSPAPSFQQMNERHLMLALEASGDAVSVALRQHDVCVAGKEHKARFGHAEHLVDLVSAALTEAGKEFSHITHIAAGCGPGSFTGLRVCLSAAKGYALATQAQRVGVNGLAALALNTLSDMNDDIHPDSQIICFADTRRQSAFVQHFDSQAQALSDVSDKPFDDLSDWLTAAHARCKGQPLILSGLTDQLSCHVPEGLDGFISISKPVNAAMIASYAACSLSAPDRYPHTDFSPLYVVAPKLGPAKQQA